MGPKNQSSQSVKNKQIKTLIKTIEKTETKNNKKAELQKSFFT